MPTLQPFHDVRPREERPAASDSFTVDDVGLDQLGDHGRDSARAMELLVTGRQIKADEALLTGLVSQIVPAGELIGKGLELARLIASKGPLAVRRTKEAVRCGADMDLAAGAALDSSLHTAPIRTSARPIKSSLT